ncbi:MAG: hypothetical protein Q4B40_05540, partial [Clostridia bacterium]|nr:hypothetical protein [Clostridia bacterium]
GSNKNIDSSEHNAVDDDNSTNPSGSILPNYEGITPEIDDEVTDNTSSDPLIDLPIVPTPTPSDTPSSNPESDVVVDKYVPVEMQAKATTYSTFTLAGTSTRGLLCIASTNDVLNEICYLPNYIDMDLAQFWIDIYGENAVNTTNVHGVHANFFKNQPNVKKIVLPRNYSYFDSDAFEHLENLTDVYIMAKYSILIDSNYYALQRNITLHCRKDLIHSNSGKLVSEYYRNLGFANYVEWDGNIDNIE